MFILGFSSLGSPLVLSTWRTTWSHVGCGGRNRSKLGCDYTGSWGEDEDTGFLKKLKHQQQKALDEASKSDKRALEGLQATVKNMRLAYERMQADLKEFEANALQLTKKLDDANVVHSVAAEALDGGQRREDVAKR
ncbi:Uncharacterized protein Adt_01511 [Abeliophyllum distichum]|uniref:Uncharacterized protein n=1 Tax=Abeliophyllum distichum TaxID=126358 RepID=A0ABD1VV20_9LAMI